MTPRRPAAIASIALLALGAGYLFGQRSTEPALRAVTLLPAPRPLPPASLAGGAGALALADPAGRWTVLFLGFTNCPDVCPTTLALLARSVAALPAEQRPRVLFLSVDPERDAQPKAAEYARWFAPEFLGATTTELEPLSAALGAPYARVATPDGGHTMDHSGALFLLDPAGRFAAVATPPHDATALAADLATLAARG